tara:strand:+ start:716 stop:886 length:171 start_codon:yes stop_codon:yes gene_type:complete
MTIIKKYFEKKPTDKQLYEFIAELIISNKGNYKTEVIYDKKKYPKYLQFNIFDERL